MGCTGLRVWRCVSHSINARLEVFECLPLFPIYDSALAPPFGRLAKRLLATPVADMCDMKHIDTTHDVATESHALSLEFVRARAPFSHLAGNLKL